MAYLLSFRLYLIVATTQKQQGVHMKQSVDWKLLIGGSALIFLSVLIAEFKSSGDFITDVAQSSQVELDEASASSNGTPTISWQLLQSFDYKNNIINDELKPILGNKIRIPGFAVPLGNDFKSIDEFLFVPNQLACIHVPAPPPHLVIMVKLKQGVHINDLSGPLWASGALTIKKSDSIYGASAYAIDAGEVSAYTY